MKLTLIEAPKLPVVFDEEVYEHLRLDNQPADRWHIRRLLESAIAELDGPNGLLGRALITQTWKLTLDKWPRVIELPLPPCQAVLSITYADTAGVTQTVPTADYRVSGLGAFCKAEIAPVSWWPSVGNVSEPIAVTFRCGYGDEHRHVPAPIRTWILERTATLYRFRESADIGGSFSPSPVSAVAALAPYRLWAF